VIDYDLIHGQPMDVWNFEKWNRVPIMAGHALNEATFYVPANISILEDFSSFWHTLFPEYSAEDLFAINVLYPDPAIGDTSIYEETRDMRTIGIRSQ
jgi:hypothetical protein